MKILLSITLTLVSLFSFGQANKLFRKAEKATDLTYKITLFSQVINLQPENLDAFFFRAIAKHDLGDYYGAIDYSKIIVEEPAANIYLNRGNSRYNIGDYENAKKDYSKAFELNKNLINAKYSLGCVKYDLGDFNAAFLDFNSIIQNYLNKKNHLILPIQVYKSFLMRALTHEELGNYTNAIEDYSFLISVKPNAENYYNRGKLLMDLKFYKEAKNDFKTSLSLNKKNEHAYFYRGASNLFLGKFLKAISDLSEAVKYNSMDFDAYLGLAVAYNKVNDPNNAKLNFEKANKLLSIGKNIKTIEQFRDTFWFKNQYFYFCNNVTKLVRLYNK